MDISDIRCYSNIVIDIRCYNDIVIDIRCYNDIVIDISCYNDIVIVFYVFFNDRVIKRNDFDWYEIDICE